MANRLHRESHYGAKYSLDSTPCLQLKSSSITSNFCPLFCHRATTASPQFYHHRRSGSFARSFLPSTHHQGLTLRLSSQQHLLQSQHRHGVQRFPQAHIKWKTHFVTLRCRLTLSTMSSHARILKKILSTTPPPKHSPDLECLLFKMSTATMALEQLQQV